MTRSRSLGSGPVAAVNVMASAVAAMAPDMMARRDRLGGNAMDNPRLDRRLRLIGRAGDIPDSGRRIGRRVAGRRGGIHQDTRKRLAGHAQNQDRPPAPGEKISTQPILHLPMAGHARMIR